MATLAEVHKDQGMQRRYRPPTDVGETTLAALLDGVRIVPANQQRRLGISEEPDDGLRIWYAGDLSLVRNPAVAIVGTRKVSPDGAARARRLAKELSSAGVVVVSGLAFGVDTEAHTATIGAGGRTIAVIGTSLNRASPSENAHLQERIYREHLLISQFNPALPVYKGNFPARNKTMAAITDATVIIEASDSSGTLHQAAECVKLDRFLFIAKSVVDDPKLTWPAKFLSNPRVRVLAETDNVLTALRETGAWH